MNLRPLIFWGSKGQSIVLYEFLEAAGFHLVAIADNDPVMESPFREVTELHGIDGLDGWLNGKIPADYSFVVAIGGSLGRDRCAISELLEQKGIRPIHAIHPNSMVARDASLSKGAQIMMGGIVGARALLDEWVIVNTGASVDHECRLGRGVHIAPGATLCGCVEVGAYTLVGAGSVVLPRVRIGEGSVVGAGSVVTRDIPDGVVAFGNPARVVRTIRSNSN
jgi:sugar O-acyltransferase (sialic acid O-acetyltransferase NeuD family)